MEITDNGSFITIAAGDDTFSYKKSALTGVRLNKSGSKEEIILYIPGQKGVGMNNEFRIDYDVVTLPVTVDVDALYDLLLYYVTTDIMDPIVVETQTVIIGANPHTITMPKTLPSTNFTVIVPHDRGGAAVEYIEGANTQNSFQITIAGLPGQTQIILPYHAIMNS